MLVLFGVGFVICIAQIKSDNKKIEERGQTLDSTLSKEQNFTASKVIKGIKNSYLFAIDSNSKKIVFIQQEGVIRLKFNQIISVELLEDSTTIYEKSTSRAIGGALVGGALAGGAGVIVGGLTGDSTEERKVSTVSVKILLRNAEQSTVSIYCFNAETMTADCKKTIKVSSTYGDLYKQGLNNAKDILDLIKIAIDKVDQATSTSSTSSSVDSVSKELSSLFELKEKGAISIDEFNTLKSKLINSINTQTPAPDEIIENNTVEFSEVVDAINRGEIIAAVSLYMEATGASISEAKAYVDSVNN